MCESFIISVYQSTQKFTAWTYLGGKRPCLYLNYEAIVLIRVDLKIHGPFPLPSGTYSFVFRSQLIFKISIAVAWTASQTLQKWGSGSERWEMAPWGPICILENWQTSLGSKWGAPEGENRSLEHEVVADPESVDQLLQAKCVINQQGKKSPPLSDGYCGKLDSTAGKSTSPPQVAYS